MSKSKKQEALFKYFVASKQHTEAEAKLPDNEFLPFDFSLLNELNKYFTSEEINTIIIHKDELIEKYLNI